MPEHGERTKFDSANTLRASVIIPAYNAAKTLPATLEALQRQSYPADLFEVIVVDDGSRDKTVEVATYGNTRVVSQANRGPAAARNHGVGLAKGAIVLFTDADCIPTRTWLERMLAPFADPTVSGVKGAYRTRQKSIIARFAQIEFEDRYQLQMRGPTIDMVDSYAAAFRRDVFLAVGGYDERFPRADNEDTDLSYRLVEHGAKLVFAPDAIVYHSHAATLARYLKVKFGRGYWRIIVYRMHKGKAVKDSYTPQTLKIQSALAAGMLTFLPAAALWQKARPYFAFFTAALFATTLPFTRFVAQRDPAVAIWTPLIAALRAIVIGAGTACALLGLGKGLALERDPQANLNKALATNHAEDEQDGAHSNPDKS